ncbi:hypothetical protein APHAL10511_004424 [Amanita phalloides]|nr:hypothetical protein APHAL10511_004424 [Amanita phalloides]
MPLHDSSSSARFCSDVSVPSQSSTTISDKCNTTTPGLYPARSPLAHRQNGLRGENAADGSNDAMQLAYEIMQHKTTIQRIANAFAV